MKEFLKYNSMPKVLYLDDDHVSLTVVQNYLKDDFYITCVSRLTELYIKLPIAAPDILLLDINLSDHGLGYDNGINIADRLRSFGLETPILFITGDRNEYCDQITHLNHVDIVGKERLQQDLIPKIKMLLRQR